MVTKPLPFPPENSCDVQVTMKAGGMGFRSTALLAQSPRSSNDHGHGQHYDIGWASTSKMDILGFVEGMMKHLNGLWKVLRECIRHFDMISEDQQLWRFSHLAALSLFATLFCDKLQKGAGVAAGSPKANVEPENPRNE